LTICARLYERGGGERGLNAYPEVMASPTIVDLCNLYRPEDARRRGFRYAGVGLADGSDSQHLF
jgi:hypothetical protein